MPVPDRSSPVNERLDSLLAVDNGKAEVIKNFAAAEPELFTHVVVNMLRSQSCGASCPNIGDAADVFMNRPGE